MRRPLHSAIALALALILGGCFESTTPLIPAANADYPFERTFHYTFYEWNKDTKVWQPSETGTISRDGDHYVQLPDIGNDQGDAFLLKSIGDNYYIAQQPNKATFIYDLVRINGNIIYQYGMSCADEDKKFVEQGLIDSFKTDSTRGNVCAVSSLEKVARLFRAIAAERPQPQGMFGVDS